MIIKLNVAFAYVTVLSLIALHIFIQDTEGTLYTVPRAISLLVSSQDVGSDHLLPACCLQAGCKDAPYIPHPPHAYKSIPKGCR